VQTESAAFRSQRPPLRLTAAEAVAFIRPATRSPLEAVLSSAPKGDGHAVLVLPALGHGDTYTASIRDVLIALGYSAHGWKLGPNIGPTKRLLNGASNRLIELSDKYGPVSIVGFSMGGLFARLLSLRTPDRVRQVITVCSPIHEPAKNFWLPLEPCLGLLSGVDLSKLADEVAQPLPVPGTFLFSRDDGLVNCAACRDSTASDDDNIEISGPHVLIARNPDGMTIVAQRLARRFETSEEGGLL
jgi:pimeloyl-ACP methyl ester carboxylesterase